MDRGQVVSLRACPTERKAPGAGRCRVRWHQCLSSIQRLHPSPTLSSFPWSSKLAHRLRWRRTTSEGVSMAAVAELSHKLEARSEVPCRVSDSAMHSSSLAEPKQR